MGRMLGYHDSDELDRPDLNKCPDCGCFFAAETCPLCGKICPEEMRAGNRAKVKPPKKHRNSSGRVQFVPWYYAWWFIILVFSVSRLAGIILFATSPYSKKLKIIVTVVVLVLSFLLYSGLGYRILWHMMNDGAPEEPTVEETLFEESHVPDSPDPGVGV